MIAAVGEQALRRNYHRFETERGSSDGLMLVVGKDGSEVMMDRRIETVANGSGFSLENVKFRDR